VYLAALIEFMVGLVPELNLKSSANGPAPAGSDP
jgi:hypothetical protein